jgi:hypothetical protein
MQEGEDVTLNLFRDVSAAPNHLSIALTIGRHLGQAEVP